MSTKINAEERGRESLLAYIIALTYSTM